MLEEILETRLMVKKSMKLYKNETALLRVLEAKQLGLKLLANVTFGYTSASFSGRMPCIDISDSIIQSGRCTLERVIAPILFKGIEYIHSVKKWNAAVVYGDTDSLFVHLPGKERAEAFAIGNEIVSDITKMNPCPVFLKFEKVYHPCVLLAKKRYVGFKFEDIHATEPEFDAKGIETVRRDGCPAVGKILESSIK